MGPANSESPDLNHKTGPSPFGGPVLLIFTKILGVLNAIGTFWILALMVLINSDVFGRFLFNAPIDGVPEMIELSIVGIVFLQLGDACRNGRLTRSDGFFNYMQRRVPKVGRAMAVIIDLLALVFMVLILIGSVPLFMEAFTENHFTGEEGVFTAPTWPIKLIIVIGCAVTLLQFFVFALRHIFGQEVGGHSKPAPTT